MRFSSSCWFLLLAFAGCGMDPASIPPPATIEVTGKAMLPNGQPITSGRINFSPPDGSIAGTESYSNINSDGTFKLQSFGGRDGAMPGTYKVFIRSSANLPLTGVHRKYSSSATTTMIVNITKETKDVGSIVFK